MATGHRWLFGQRMNVSFVNDADVLIAAAAKGAEQRLLAANQPNSARKP